MFAGERKECTPACAGMSEARGGTVKQEREQKQRIIGSYGNDLLIFVFTFIGSWEGREHDPFRCQF